MGKILDSLRKSDGQRNGHDQASGASVACPAPPAAAEEEFPYIEIGGPGKKIEGSPAVLAVSVPAPKLAPPSSPPQPTVEQGPARLTTLAVDFEPWHATTLGLGMPAPEIVCYHQPEHSASQQYGALHDGMLALLPQGRPAALLLTGLTAGSGTTTILLNLAFAAALQRKKRVAIVDANLREPALAQRLGLTPATALNDVLTGAAALDAAFAKAASPLVHVLAGKPTVDASNVLARDAVNWLLSRLRERFDLILVDGPHLGDHPELPALLNCSDAMFLVVKQEMLNQCDRPKLAKLLARLGGTLKGLVHARVM